MYFIFYFFCFHCILNHISLEGCPRIPTYGIREGFLDSRFENLRLHLLIKNQFFYFDIISYMLSKLLKNKKSVFINLIFLLRVGLSLVFNP